MVDFDVQTVVENVIRDRLNMVEVVSVRTVRDADFDGDTVLRVTVVVDSPASSFNTKRLSGLVRHIRHKLTDVRETAFPLVSFMSKQDADKLARVAH